MDITDTPRNGTKDSSNNSNTRGKTDKPKRHLPSLPSALSASDMSTVAFSGLVDRTPVEWSSLENYEAFSLAADGSFPMLKVSRSKAVRLSDRKVLMVGSGRCFRISQITNTLVQSRTDKDNQ
ncbi:hypothetical protein H6G33_17840 [Calothrix sp. FACHB-1219]|uniref:hypothetical protein n=1 Tax=unclassified Calothrix TaxID=2619626 RepID=UPI001688DDF8|nr:MULTISPECIES: hypothetical protein [unclassified Calothrix]MBD2202741.1 hypothetical protein [Calothrix sp. FACHB-168]MBD2218894.1 hypothetical protein [Calothrix sp. FACHB-1219]